MPVRLVNKHILPRGNRARQFDLAVQALAPTIQRLQSAGIRDIRQLVERLKDEGELAPSGRPLSYGTMRRILRRLRELHLGLGPRTLTLAATQRPERPHKFRPSESRPAKHSSVLKRMLAEIEAGEAAKTISPTISDDRKVAAHRPSSEPRSR
jgi:hypothetical protein